MAVVYTGAVSLVEHILCLHLLLLLLLLHLLFLLYPHLSLLHSHHPGLHVRLAKQNIIHSSITLCIYNMNFSSLSIYMKYYNYVLCYTQ